MELSTPRLLLREFQENDWHFTHLYESQESVMRYQTSHVRSSQESRDYLLQCMAEAREDPRTLFDLAVVLKSTNMLIGRVGMKIDYDAEEAALWYLLNPTYWNKGYTTEAARALIEYGFEELHLHRFWADCDPRNVGSYRVMEKLGMRREAHFKENIFIKGEWCDSLVYALLDHEWQHRQPL
ncbi:GNAT family N-acetyltransferase [Rufibacter quisquiliarum]|uniref:RimJ/RimL family protein N-acetyltransferase n=1 Tax=Rufibacter quisquiliarum TaxID=1549639 RepID=A0A839GG79_9BACT|nr:GNAT family protein [Rufibacter quisquiliarum]MBA9075659.1 RimJ/RimL family protein N-acetyltransferase [Rufibacter quisquiliarum]